MGSAPVSDVNVRSWGRQIGLNTQHASPPVNAYITPDDSILVELYNRTTVFTVNVNARILLPDGRIVMNTWPCQTTGVGAAGYPIRLPEGFLLSLNVMPTVLPANYGSCFAVVYLCGGGTIANQSMQILASGFISEYRPISWPPGPQERSTEGRGWLHSQLVSVPAAGADFSITVPSNLIWRVSSVIATLVTSATVATRITHLVIDDGTNVVSDSVMRNGVTASSTQLMTWGSSFQQAAPSDNSQPGYLEDGLVVPAGFRIRSLTTALQAADQYSAIYLLVEEWPWL
jgi:hypothetical protein